MTTPAPRRALPLAAALLPLVAANLLAPAPAARAQSDAPPAGFGRFGRLHDDGLLTLNVTPHGFTTVGDAPVRVTWGDGNTPVRVAGVARLDPTEKRLKLTGGGAGAPSAVRYTLLYPGLSATFAGPTAVLRFSGGSGLRAVFVKQDGSPAGLILRSGGVDRLEVRTAPGIGIRGGTPAADGTVTVTLTRKGGVGEVRFVTPNGIAAAPRRGTTFVSADTPVPTRVGYREVVSADGKRVTITERFTGGVAPLPPVLAFARQRGYPVKVDGTVIDTGVASKWGPYCYVRGNTLRYTLPVPPTDERGYVRPASVDPRRVALLNGLVGHLGGDWATNGVDLGYAGMANALMAEPFLSPARRAEVAAAWKRYLPQAFVMPPYKPGAKTTWNVATEPLTRQSYLWTYKIDGPGGLNYDIEWGNALPLYGLYKYAAYTGDWALVRRSWPAVKRVYRYLDLGDDWAWMTVVNADHGYSTGTGDPLCAAYAGHIACLKMARVVGDREWADHLAARAARVAVPTAMRFAYTAYAREHGLIGGKSVALGYQEAEGFTRSEMGGNPWYPTTLLSGDGALPELFDLYAAFVPRDLRAFETEYARAYPDWSNGRKDYPFRTTYQGNSVYVTFPHLYARAAVLGEGTGPLLRHLDAAQSNRNNAWIGPNVVAELLSRAPNGTAPALLLTDWTPAAYRGGDLSADARRATLRFALAAPGAWTLAAKPAPGRRVVRALLDGKPVPVAIGADGRARLTARRPEPGPFIVTLELR